MRGRDAAAIAGVTAVALQLLASIVPAAAQTAGATDQILETLQLKARLAPAPDFVQRDSGRSPRGFIPVGREGRERPVKPMTPAELASATADLDAAREGQQRRAGRRPAAVPDKPSRGSTERRR